MRGWFVLVVTATVLGCGGGVDPYVAATRSRAHVALTCPSAEIHISGIGGGGYLAAGCGRRQTYTCALARTTGFRQNVVCMPDSAVERDAATAGGAVTPSRTTTEDAALAVEAIETCSPGGITATLSLTIGPDGQATALTTPGVPDELGTCFIAAVWRVRFAARASAESVVIRLAPIDPDADAPFVAPAAPAPSGDPAATERSARAVVDSVRDAVLACTGTTAAAVVADWAADGTLTLHLSGAGASTPADGCVRALSPTTPLTPAPGSAGSVLHPVR